MTSEWSNAIFDALDFERVGWLDRDQVLGRWAAAAWADGAEVGASRATTTTTATSDGAFTTWPLATSAREGLRDPRSEKLSSESPAAGIGRYVVFFSAHVEVLKAPNS